MKIITIHFLFILLSPFYGSFAQNNIEIIKLTDLQQLIKKQNKITVINFWASWCKPCVSEIPFFERLVSDFPSNKVSVVFISLDFKKDLETVEKFITTYQIKSKVYLIDEPDHDSWIDKVSTQWSGTIPATLISNGIRQEFYEQSFDYQSLSEKIQHFF
jgi:thiol-disulfide isomerase/thioredoxin